MGNRQEGIESAIGTVLHDSAPAPDCLFPIPPALPYFQACPGSAVGLPRLSCWPLRLWPVRRRRCCIPARSTVLGRRSGTARRLERNRSRTLTAPTTLRIPLTIPVPASALVRLRPSPCRRGMWSLRPPSSRHRPRSSRPSSIRSLLRRHLPNGFPPKQLRQ